MVPRCAVLPLPPPVRTASEMPSSGARAARQCSPRRPGAGRRVQGRAYHLVLLAERRCLHTCGSRDAAPLTQRALRHSEGQRQALLQGSTLHAASAQFEIMLKVPSYEQQSGPFKEAAADELAKRRIVKARRSGSSAGSLP